MCEDCLLKVKEITALINMVVLGRNKTTFDVVQSNLPQNSSTFTPFGSTLLNLN